MTSAHKKLPRSFNGCSLRRDFTALPCPAALFPASKTPWRHFHTNPPLWSLRALWSYFFLEKHFLEGSDPGLCVVPENGSSVEQLMAFGREASCRIVTQKEAMQAVNGCHLSGHGGTNDGIIGAAAGVGLTLTGWSGRFIEFNDLRRFEKEIRVGELEKHGIRVLSIDRNDLVPSVDDRVDTRNWLRPRLWGDRPVLPVRKTAEGRWQSLGGKHGAEKPRG